MEQNMQDYPSSPTNPEAYPTNPGAGFQSTYTQKKESGKLSCVFSIIFSILGILNGALSIIFGILRLVDPEYGGYTSSETYGGDAYTGIQNACADVANNVDDLLDVLQVIFGQLLIVIGIAFICYFTLKLINACKKKG